MNKWLKRSAMVGLLSGVAMFGVGCQRSGHEGTGGAGKESGKSGYGAPSDTKKNEPATGGSGTEMEHKSFEQQHQQTPPPGTGGAGENSGMNESRHDDSMMQPDAGMGGSGMEDGSMQHDMEKPKTDTETQPTY